MTLDEITYEINGCAMKVHNTLGNDFQEVIYQRCLAIEMDRAGLSFGREIEQVILYFFQNGIDCKPNNCMSEIPIYRLQEKVVVQFFYRFK